MKRLLAIVVVSLLLGGAIGYGVYAKACEMKGGTCCGQCPVPPTT